MDQEEQGQWRIGQPQPLRAVRQFQAENPSKFDPREWMKPARAAAQAICKQRYLEFGCEGQGAKVKGIPLSVMAEKYAKGELAQQVV